MDSPHEGEDFVVEYTLEGAHLMPDQGGDASLISLVDEKGNLINLETSSAVSSAMDDPRNAAEAEETTKASQKDSDSDMDDFQPKKKRNAGHQAKGKAKISFEEWKKRMKFMKFWLLHGEKHPELAADPKVKSIFKCLIATASKYRIEGTKLQYKKKIKLGKFLSDLL